jgi:ParB family transcriptional regulator, chromosome partitioning protein
VTPKPPERRALGRGLDALLPLKPAPTPGPTDYGEGNVFTCPLEKLAPQKNQPRQHFDPVALDELASSIRERGVIEPLVVRRVSGTDRFEIVAGERRWRAAQRAGLREVLVVVRDVSAADAYELALIENVQREDLNPIEFAQALDHLVKHSGYTQEVLAARVGKDRSTVANVLRLLRLPEAIRGAVLQGELTEGHARTLLGLPDETAMSAVAEKVIRGHLSVRETEGLVRAAKRAARGEAPGDKQKTASVRDLEHRLERKLGTKCQVRDQAGKGQILISYSSLDELDRLLEILL